MKIITLCMLAVFFFAAEAHAAGAAPATAEITRQLQQEDTLTPARSAGKDFTKTADPELQKMIRTTAGKFRQFSYTDAVTGDTFAYNLYIPQNYDPEESYPLVLFIADSSTVGKSADAPLTQGTGGLVWATAEEQLKHRSFVLVPEYPEKTIDDFNGFVTSTYIEDTVRLLEMIKTSYSIDSKRIYGTGQSMGCMTVMYLSAIHPELFAAELYVSGQWDITTLSPLQDQTFFYITAQGDPKASAGQAEVLAMLNNAGAAITLQVWNAGWSAEKTAQALRSLLAADRKINMITFERGSVLPAGTGADASEHMYSFDHAYKITGIRDWLFRQRAE